MNAVDLIEHAKDESSNLLQLKNDDKVTMGYYDNCISFIKNGKYVGKSPYSSNLITFPDNREKHYLKAENTIIIDTGSTYVGIDAMTGLELWNINKEALWIKDVTDKEFILTDNTGNVTRIEAATGKKTIDRPNAKNSKETSSNSPIKFTFNIKNYEGPFQTVRLQSGHILMKFTFDRDDGMSYSRCALITRDGQLIFETDILLSFSSEFWLLDDYLYYIKDTYSPDKLVKCINLISNTVTETMKTDIPKTSKKITIEDCFIDDEYTINEKNKVCSGLSQEELIKKTGIKPHKNVQGNKSFFHSLLSVVCSGGYVNCSRYNVSGSDGDSDASIDMIGVYDLKTWKKLWLVESRTSQVKLYKDKLLLTDDKIFELKSGKLLYKFKDEAVSDIAGNLCLVYSPKITTSSFNPAEGPNTILKITALDLDMIAAGKK